MKILITRPEPDGSRLARILKKMGHETRLAPMMHIENLRGKQVDITGAQALLVTSANGARALGRALKPRDIKVFAVGAATAEAVRHEGFKDVHAAGGEVNSLAAKVIAECLPENGRLIHVAGSEVAGDLSGMLSEKGFQCTRVVLYEALPVTSLDGEVVRELKSGAISAVLFYSPRTAAIFVDLVTTAGLTPYMKEITAYCLSQAVADKLEPLSFAGIHVAAEPDQENLLALLAAVSQARTQEDTADMPRERNMSDKKSGKTEDEGKAAVPSAGTDRKKTGDAQADNKDTARTESPVTPEPAAPKSRAGLVFLLLIVVFCLGLAAWPVLYPKLEPYLPTETAAIISGQFGKSSGSDMSDATAAIEAIRDNLKSDYASLSERVSKIENSAPVVNTSPGVDDGKLTALSGSLKEELSGLSSELAEQQKKLSAALEELNQQKENLGKLENADPVVADPSPEIQSEIVDLKTALLDIKRQITSLETTITSDREAVKSQAEQLSSLEGTLKAEIASKSEGEAENQRTLMLLAISQLQRETRGNEPFENGLKQVAAVADDKFNGLIEKLQPIAPVGAPTLASLQKDFTAIASDISQSARLPSEETWYGEALHRIASAVKFRRVDDMEGNDVDAVVARAEQDLAENDLDNAVAEIEKLSGAPAEVAASWLDKAKTRLTVEQSIAGLLQEATTTAISQPTSN
ncbi:uroporphyrinogen-III synthase [uncultured Sneathiella sp.]|uniref:uroporphyrinogen-III synthase n=1 Tax=uncultured Sneathiella sp. TaxID=879315 RepID=UPI002591FE03|nr:uroporphyrinogen-III synthase [uncultured Sneathiella sp.]